MESLKLLTSNYLINVCVVAWFLAQALKVILTYITERKIQWERMVGAGGMPSSHSALVCSLAIGMARKVGFASPEFALALAFAAVVMYDAMGVRRAAGEQAKVLNKIVFGFPDIWAEKKTADTEETEHSPEEESGTVADKALKEYLGHTPLEVLGGALLGILVSMLLPVV